MNKILGIFAILTVLLVRFADTQGVDYNVCGSPWYIQGYDGKWGTVSSENYPNTYNYYYSCSFEIYVRNPLYEYISLRVIDWISDGSYYGDRISIWFNTNGYWQWANDIYMMQNPGWINSYRQPGHVRINWYTDGYRYYLGRWRMTWTFQKYVFGCEIYPQPYVTTNTTKHGIIKSPFFPDHYPVNAYCTTIIDVDQATDYVEFVTQSFNFRQGDFLYFYTGDVYLNNWVQYAAFTANPGTFRIYGADVKILFTSDHVGCSYGYMIYWRIISKERYAFYKPEKAIAYFPMTAAHRGLDIVGGCVGTPNGTVVPTMGPFGHAGSGLYFKGAFMTMKSGVCPTSTRITSSYTTSLFMNTAEYQTYVFHYEKSPSGNAGVALIAHRVDVGSFWAPNAEDYAAGLLTNGLFFQNSWQMVSVSHDNVNGKLRTYSGPLKRGEKPAVLGTVPSATQGLVFGKNPLMDPNANGTVQTGRFACFSIYGTAMGPEDMAQLRTLCQKIHEQYEIYPASTLWAWWPLSGAVDTVTGFVRDTSGNGRHGKLTGTATAADGPFLVPSTAYSFSGATSNYISAPAVANEFKSITINFYAYLTNGRPMLVSPGSAYGPNGLFIRTFSSKIQFLPDQSKTEAVVGEMTPDSFNVWAFISVSYDARSTTVRMYLDGVLKTTQNLGAGNPLAVSGSGVRIANNGDFSNAYSGALSCISIYKNALTAAQIAKVMASCQMGYGQPPKLVEMLGFWPLTNLTKFDDISGNNFHGVAMSTNVTLTTGPFGVPNTAVTLGDDASAYVNFNHAGLDLVGGSWSWSCWIYVTSPGPILEYVNSATPATAGAAGVGVNLWAYDGYLFMNTLGLNVSGNGFNLKQWQFISVTYDSDTSTISLYRDGSRIGFWSAASNSASNFGFNLGYRVFENTIIKAKIACLSIYQVALSAEGVGRVMAMCQSYLMDQALRDNSRQKPEINCDFDNGFCGWSVDTESNDGVQWQLGHDGTPTGTNTWFSTGPRFGKSAERQDALDQYAYVDANLAGPSRTVSMRSPIFSPGWHCFQMWYYMGGANVNSLRVRLALSNKQIILRTGYQGRQWLFAVASFLTTADEQLEISATTGSTKYSDIAIDDVRLTEGRCGGTAPCPRGWLDFGSKCYMNFLHMQLSHPNAVAHCNRMKAHVALPEDINEMNFLRSLLPFTTSPAHYMHLGADRVAGNGWVNQDGYAVQFFKWGYGEPDSGQNYLGLQNGAPGSDQDGMQSGHPTSQVTAGFLCEVSKIEAQYLGFNCSFDGKHTCGWINNNMDTAEDSANGGVNIDIDTWAGLSNGPWQNEDNENGPQWDFNHGNTRGYYAMVHDASQINCTSSYVNFGSPVITKAFNKPQCLRFRTYRTAMVNKIEVIKQLISTSATFSVEYTYELTGTVGLNWRTFSVDLSSKGDFRVLLRMWMSCGGSGWGNQVIDDIQLFDGPCTVPLFTGLSTSPYNSLRPQPNHIDSVDSIGDTNFYTCSGWNQWRFLQGSGVNFNWGCNAFQYQSNARQNGPQSDYTGEGFYINADSTSGGSLTGMARLTGPPIPSGQRCFIFHYFQNGYDVGELRLVDGKGKSLWARQRSQNPAWKEHRILFNDHKATNVWFEASSTFYDGSTHFQKYGALQLDDIYTRNGSDLCLGFMDCDFDKSSYLTDCGWQQNDTDDADWLQNSGETPAGNRLTGPSADQTTGLGYYLYFEATGLKPEAKARVHMPPIAAGEHCLTFYYHMWGKDTGTLRVFYVPQNNLRQSKGNFPPYSETTVWARKGEQANFWVRAVVPLNLAYSQILTFEAIRGFGDRGDIAIDDVVVLEGSCPQYNDHGLSCTFDRGDSCNWYSDWSASKQFEVRRGKTLGAPMTGPEGDANGLYAGGYYAVFQGSKGVPGDVARLMSPTMPVGTVCLQFAYNMRGRTLGRLNLYRNSELLVSLRSSSTGYEWRRLARTVSSNETFQLKIEAVWGSTLSDIAVDDLKITEGSCRFANAPVVQDQVSEFKRETGFVLTKHLISSVIAQSYVDCLERCKRMLGCASFNYKISNRECQFNDASRHLDPLNFASASADNSYTAVVSNLRQLDEKLQSLCALDSPTCTMTRDCVQLSHSNMFVCKCVEAGRSCHLPPDCSIAFMNGYTGSGVYLIMPTLNSEAVQAYCQMDLQANRGYTVLAYRNNGGTRFHGRSLAEYKGFFGSSNGEHWIGLETMHKLTQSATFGYMFDGALWNTVYPSIDGLSTVEPIKVANETDKYRIRLKKQGAMTTKMDNAQFATTDWWGDGCIENHAWAGWWYQNCLDGSLTGLYRPAESLTTTRLGMYSVDFDAATVGASMMRWKITRL